MMFLPVFALGALIAVGQNSELVAASQSEVCIGAPPNCDGDCDVEPDEDVRGPSASDPHDVFGVFGAALP